jgi:hypothetical protein
MLILWGGNFAVGVGWVVLISGKFCPVWGDFSLTGCLVKHRVAAARYDEKKRKAVAQKWQSALGCRAFSLKRLRRSGCEASRAFLMFCNSWFSMNGHNVDWPNVER